MLNKMYKSKCRIAKHNRLRILTLVASMAIVSSASLAANASTFINSSDYLDYELPKSVQDSCNEQQRCPEIEVQYLNSNLQWINAIVNKRINNIVVNSQPSEAAVSKTASSAKDVSTAIDAFAKAQFIDMPTGSSWSYNLMVSPEYLGHIDAFELFRINSYVFTGGAHGMPYSEYLIFDPSSRQQVQLKDMLRAGKKPRLERLAYNAYRAWVKTVDEDVDNYEKNWPFIMSDNVTLTDKGLDIQYQHYDIGPYAYGMPVLSIAYDKLDGIIKPRFIAKIK